MGQTVLAANTRLILPSVGCPEGWHQSLIHWRIDCTELVYRRPTPVGRVLRTKRCRQLRYRRRYHTECVVESREPRGGRTPAPGCCHSMRYLFSHLKTVIKTKNSFLLKRRSEVVIYASLIFSCLALNPCKIPYHFFFERLG